MLLEVVVFFEEDEELVEQDFLQQDFLLDVEQEQFAYCSKAIDQNFSSCPLGQPAFCHK